MKNSNITLNENAIREAAYFIWKNNGCPANTSLQDWNAAINQLLYPTEKAEAMKASKAEIEASFYEYLTSVLTDDESETFAALLNKLYTASKTESRAGFPHFIQAQRK